MPANAPSSLITGAQSLAGRLHREKPHSDFVWAAVQPVGSLAIRAFGVTIRKVSRLAIDRITYDRASFVRAIAAVPPGAQMALAPSHRSYADFLLCSYLCFADPELGLRIPHIAAAEEFKRIPVLGTLFTMAQAFYLRRGVGREDPELTRTVHGLIARGEVIEFFIEGARSRSRQFLAPRTGLLRCMQGTGRTLALMPVAITYDHVPEEAVLDRELSGAPKPPMRLTKLFGWTRAVLRGQVALGRIHLTCAPPVVMAPDDDVQAVARQILGGLQAHTAATAHHLRCFAQHAGIPDLDLTWLTAELVARGATVIDSELRGEAEVKALTELSLRQQWLHWFYPEALVRWAGHPVLRNEAIVRSWQPGRAGATSADPRLDRLLSVLFAPLLRDTSLVLDHLADDQGALRHPQPAAVLSGVPGVHLLHAQAVYDALSAEGILARDAATRTYVWGPQAAALPAFRDACCTALGGELVGSASAG